MANTAAAIRATLGLDTAPLDAGLARANASVGGFAKKFKSATSSMVSAFGGGAIAASIRGMVESFKDLVEPVETSEDAIRSMRRELSGLSEDQAEQLAGMASNYQAAGNAIVGYFGKVLLAIKALVGRKDESTTSAIDEDTTQRIKLSNKEMAELNRRRGDAEKKAKRESEEATNKELELRKKIAEIDNDISDAQERSASERLTPAEKALVIERKISEAKAAQVGKVDELSQAEAKRKQALLEIEKLDSAVAEKLKGPDQRRQERRDVADIRRATRTVQNRDRDAEEIARKNGRKLPAREAVGEIQGPQLPPGQAGATEATMKEAVIKLSTIAASLGVRL